MEPWQKARGAGPRHPSGPLGFLHGRVRVPQDARPVVGAGLGSGRDRPRPGDERHAGIGNPRRAPRQDARHHQTGEGHGRQARPRGTRVRGGGAEPAACGRHHLRAHGQRLVRLHGVRRRRVRPQDRRLGARHPMDTRELPLQALEQAISWAASHGGTDGLVHHSDHGAQYLGLVYATRVGEFGMLPSTGTVGASYGNAMAESADGAYRTELVWRRKPSRILRDLKLATFRWVSWRGLEASAPVLGPQDTGTDRNRVLCEPSGASRPAIRAEQKSGHIMLLSVRLTCVVRRNRCSAGSEMR